MRMFGRGRISLPFITFFLSTIADGKAGEVVFPFGIEAGHFRRLPADERASPPAGSPPRYP